MQAKLFGSALHGVDAFRISVEVSVDKGLGYMITGLPDAGIKESYNRIHVAITNNHFTMPRTKLVINLAPADIRKAGTAFDLPIAVGILIASGQFEENGKMNDYIIAGELGLDGTVYPVRGAMCMAWQARKENCKGIILPEQNATEASLVEGLKVYCAKNLKQVLSLIANIELVEPYQRTETKPVHQSTLDFNQVKGQPYAKRALEIMSAGGHNGLLIGAPGAGKSMLAKRIPTILPPMTAEESLETTRIHSLINNNGIVSGLITERPFISPHHTTSDTALIGGGTFPLPGAISQAHNGVLFADEFGEFKNTAIESLRQPLEDRKVLIARAKQSLEFPASFTLLAAMNPCPCGYLGHPTRKCSCSKRAIWWYRRKLSGPVLERIDMHIEVEPVSIEDLLQNNDPEESSDTIRERVVFARKIQSKRFSEMPGVHSNAQMPDALIQELCPLEEVAQRFLFKQMEKLGLSARSYSRILKVGRTIADLAGKEVIEIGHIAEAISFRKLDLPLPGQPSSKHEKQTR